MARKRHWCISKLTYKAFFKAWRDNYVNESFPKVVVVYLARATGSVEKRTDHPAA